MKKTIFNENVTARRERIMAKHAVKSSRRKVKTGVVPAVVAGICAVATVAGASAFGLTLMNNAKVKIDDIAAVSAKLLNTPAFSSTVTKRTLAVPAPADSVPNTPAQNKAGLNNAANTGAQQTETATISASNSAQQTETAKETPKTVQNAPGTHHSGVYPTGNGVPLKVEAFGKTSYGYDWTFTGGGGLVKVGCTYNFANNRYEFDIIGVEPGSDTITLSYRDFNGNPVPMTINFTVDSNLNVTSR